MSGEPINDVIHAHNFTLCGRPLKFGDLEQIAAYKKMNSEAAEQEAYDEAEDNDELHLYKVVVTVSGRFTMDIHGSSQKNAEYQVRSFVEDLTPDELDIDTECNLYTGGN